MAMEKKRLPHDLNDGPKKKYSYLIYNFDHEFLISQRIDILNEAGEVAGKTSFNDAFWQIYHDAQRQSTDENNILIYLKRKNQKRSWFPDRDVIYESHV